ncbi:tRNA pseudouridine(38-40) synthase TruA [bacterium]|nr:tRNA pseudouridine(38-40) synthase TruA [bacterium]
MRNIRLIIGYDGTSFHGWQFQPGTRTVEGELVAGLSRVLREPVKLLAASRTDSGVHARGQAANFMTESSIDLLHLLRGANSTTPYDIAVFNAAEAPLDFHSTRDAIGKHYRYCMRLADMDEPIARRTHWWYRYQLDVDAMRAAAPLLTGTRDFRGLKVKSGRPNESTVRTVTDVALSQDGADLMIDIRGKGFMYKQVRSMVGMLVAAGRGRVRVADIPALLAGDPAQRRTEVAPPHGLTLMEVFYAPQSSAMHEETADN